MRPGVAAVGRLEDAEAGLGVGRRVGLSRARVENAPLVEERPDRVGRQAAGDVRPACSAARKRVVGPPDAAAGSTRPDAAARARAVRIGRKRRHATGGCVISPREREDPWIVGMARAGERPLPRLIPGVRRATRLDARPRPLRVQRELERNRVRGIRIVGVFLGGFRVDAGLAVRLATVADDVLGRQLAGENMALARPRRPAGHCKQER